MLRRRRPAAVAKDGPASNVPAEEEVRILTVNAAMFRSVCGFQVNGSFLRPNRDRAEGIVKRLAAWNDAAEEKEKKDSSPAPHFVAFQEMFDRETRYAIAKKLERYYPYSSELIDQEGCCTVGDGLMLLSRYPLKEEWSQTFTNSRLSEETLAAKGFRLWIVDHPKGQFHLMNTHLHSDCDFFDCVPGAGWLKQLSHWWGGTDRERRLQQMEEIVQYAGRAQSLVFLAGDLNEPLSDLETMRKLPLFRLFSPALPKNSGHMKGTFIPREVLSRKKREGIKVQPEDAMPGQILDGVFATARGCETEVVSFGDETDHFGVVGKFKF